VKSLADNSEAYVSKGAVKLIGKTLRFYVHGSTLEYFITLRDVFLLLAGSIESAPVFLHNAPYIK
jgi:hypothetical protein